MKRTGAAVALPLALIVIALLVPLMAARHIQGSHTRGNVAKTVRASLVVDVAKAAVAEGWWRLERMAYDSSNPLYLSLRGGPPVATNFTLEVPFTASSLADDPQLSGCSVVDGKVKVTMGPKTQTNPRSRECVLDVTVEARVSHSWGIARTVRETREMRLALLALPPPFDARSLVVLDASFLVGDQTNKWMEDAVSIVNQIVSGIKGAGGSTQGEVPAPLHDDLAREIHRFPSKYSILSADAAVPDIAAIYLAPKVEARHRKIESLGPPEALMSSAASDPEGTAKKAGILAQAHNALLDEVKAFQKLWSESGNVDVDNLNGLANQLSPTEWRKRAWFTFSGPGAPKRLLEMLDGYAKEDPPRGVLGIVYLDNPDEPLKLQNLTLRGRLVIVATGQVEVSELKVSDPARDLLAIQAEGQMTTSGRIESSLIMKGGAQMSSDTVIAGTLFLDRPRANDKYGGKIEWDAARQSTQTAGLDRPEMFWIAFAPYAKSREMTE